MLILGVASCGNEKGDSSNPSTAPESTSASEASSIESLVSSEELQVSSNSETSIESLVSSEEIQVSSSSETSIESSEIQQPIVNLQDVLAKDYSNLTYEESFSLVCEEINYESGYEQTELIDSNKVQIFYYDDNTFDTWYYEVLDEEVKLYTLNDNSEWEYQLIDFDTFDYSYYDYAMICVSPNEYNLNNDYFNFEDNTFVCKDDSLNKVGPLFADKDSLGCDSITYSSIVLTIDGEYLSSICVNFSASLNGLAIECELKLSYSDINNTHIELPEAVEHEDVLEVDFINPKDAQPLSTEQAKILEGSLDAPTNNFTCNYQLIDSDEYLEVYETLLYDNGKNDYYTEVYVYGMLYYSSQSYSKEESYGNILYELDENNIVVTSLLDDDEYYDYSPYSCGFDAFGYTSDLFGIYENIYVCTTTGLAKLNEVVANEDSCIVSVEIYLNEDNSIRTVKEVYYYYETDNYDAYYETCIYNYSNVGSTTVTLPKEGECAISDLNEQLSAAFTNATNISFDNVTVYDSITEQEFYFVDNIVQALYFDYDSYEYYYSTYKTEDGKYFYLNEDDQFVEFPFEDGYNISVPVIDFSVIDLSKVTYNSFTKSYYLSGDDVDASALIYYYASELEITDFEFVLDAQGNLSVLYITVLYEGELIDGIGLQIYNYKETELL